MKQTELNKLKELLLEGEYKLVTIETELEKAKKVPRSQLLKPKALKQKNLATPHKVGVTVMHAQS